MNESAFCDVCHVAYEHDYSGPCHEPAPRATDAQLASGHYPRCPGTVSLDAAVQMQRERAERAEATLRRIADAESGIWGQIAHAALHPERKAA